MRPRCPFTHRGHPTTAPGTPEDKKRIALSQWITAILVRHGDEQPGEYTTPGASGYTRQQLAAHRAAEIEAELATIPLSPAEMQLWQALREKNAPHD